MFIIRSVVIAPSLPTCFSRKMPGMVTAIAKCDVASLGDHQRFDELKTVDWSFPERTRQSDLEAIHPYPAKFIPELPGTLLDLIPLEPGTSVLDPFVGSGTTLVECQKRGLPSIGIDLNPIACLISRVKTTALPANFDTALETLLATALKIIASRLTAGILTTSCWSPSII